MRVALSSVMVVAVMMGMSCATPSTTERENLPPLQTVKRVDLERYLGTWFEIASIPQRFQQGCTATTATYSPGDDGAIHVRNRCRKDGFTGRESVAEGTARVVDATTNAKLEVSFFGPFGGDYWIIDLDEGYQWAVVGSPTRDSLWILSRTPTLDEAVYRGIIERLRGQGYDPLRLQMTPQPPLPEIAAPSSTLPAID